MLLNAACHLGDLLKSVPVCSGLKCVSIIKQGSAFDPSVELK